MRIPLIEQLKENGFSREDVIAGLTTAIMLIPQAMAYAMLAGLPPIVGLYASTLPLAIYALFGTSRQLAVGPVAMVSLLVAAGVAPLAGGDVGQYVAYAALLALMVGVIQLAMGLGRFGFIVEYLSHPVIAGFTSAAALIIGFSQLKHLLGVEIARSHHVHTIVLEAIRKLGEIQPQTALIGFVAAALLVALKKWAPRFPRFLFVVAAATTLVWGLGLDAVGVGTVGDVPAGLPSPSLPDFAGFGGLVTTAVVISLVGFMESISVAKAFARKSGYEIDADKELIALGAGNLVAGVFAGYPITGGFSRTAVNAQAGAKTGLAALITAALVVATLLFLTPLFYYLPKAVLAAIIMTAVFGLVDIKEAKHLFHVSKPDLLVMATTFLATLTLGIELGILVGVAASLVGFLRRMSRPHLARLGRLPDSTLYRKMERNPEAEELEGVLAVRIDGPLFFANASYLRTELRELEEDVEGPLKKLVIDATAISGLDASAMQAVLDVVEEYEGRTVEVWFAGTRGPIRDAMTRAGIVKRVGTDRMVQSVHEAVIGTGATQPPESPSDRWSGKAGPGAAIAAAIVLLVPMAYAGSAFAAPSGESVIDSAPAVKVEGHAWVQAAARFDTEGEHVGLPMVRGNARLRYESLEFFVQADAGDADFLLLDVRGAVRLGSFSLLAGRTKVPVVDAFMEPAPEMILPRRAQLVALGPRRAWGATIGYRGDRADLELGMFAGEEFGQVRSPSVVARSEIELSPALNMHVAGGGWTGRAGAASDPEHDRYADLAFNMAVSDATVHLEGILSRVTGARTWSSGAAAHVGYRMVAGPVAVQPVLGWDVIEEGGTRHRATANVNFYGFDAHLLFSAAYQLGVGDSMNHTGLLRLQVGA